MRILRRFQRSAICPAGMAIMMTGIACSSPTHPSTMGLLVLLYRSQPRATLSTCWPMTANIQAKRKTGRRNVCPRRDRAGGNFDTGLFTATFDRLSNQPTGFAADGVMNVVTGARPPQSVLLWQQVAEQLRSASGRRDSGAGGFPAAERVHGGRLCRGQRRTARRRLVRFLSVSPAWFAAMKIPFVSGRDFTESDASPGVAIVNQTFANVYFNGEKPVGRSFDTNRDHGMRCRIVGVARRFALSGDANARYRRSFTCRSDR